MNCKLQLRYFEAMIFISDNLNYKKHITKCTLSTNTRKAIKQIIVCNVFKLPNMKHTGHDFSKNFISFKTYIGD